MNLNNLQAAIAMWAAVNAQEATEDTVMLHLNEELEELSLAVLNHTHPLTVGPADAFVPDVAEEAADIVLLLAHLAQLVGYSLGDAVAEKLNVVMQRAYAQGEDGVYRHVQS